MNKVEITECDDLMSRVLASSSIDEAGKVFGGNDCIALPLPYNAQECYYAQETIDFIKYCRESDDVFSIDTLASGDFKSRSLHSFDIFMPILWIASEVLLPIAINLVSDYIHDKMKGREHEEANVELSFIVERSNERKMLHYKGPANAFREEFEKVDLNEL